MNFFNWKKFIVCLFVCLVISLIIGLSVKYGIKTSNTPATINPDTNSQPAIISKTTNPSPTPSTDPNTNPSSTNPNPSYIPSESPTSLPTSPILPTTISTQSPIGCKPVIHGKIGDCCHWNDTCQSHVCANTHQSIGTGYHNTCLPANLQQGAICYNDESCLTESCEYNWSNKKYMCN